MVQLNLHIYLEEKVSADVEKFLDSKYHSIELNKYEGIYVYGMFH